MRKLLLVLGLVAAVGVVGLGAMEALASPKLIVVLQQVDAGSTQIACPPHGVTRVRLQGTEVNPGVDATGNRQPYSIVTGCTKGSTSSTCTFGTANTSSTMKASYANDYHPDISKLEGNVIDLSNDGCLLAQSVDGGNPKVRVYQEP